MNASAKGKLVGSLEDLMSNRQVTIGSHIQVEGRNILWRGSGEGNSYPEMSVARFYPAKENRGISFKVGNVLIPATLDNAVHRYNGIGLDYDGTSVNVTEHLLSAIFALGIDNVVIELLEAWRNVCPVTDNYAKDYIGHLLDARVLQSPNKKYLTVEDRGELCYVVSYKSGTKTAQLETMSEEEFIRTKPNNSLLVKRGDGFSIRYRAGFPHQAIGEQEFALDVNLANYREHIESARSIAFREAIIEGIFPNPMRVGDIMDMGNKGLVGFNDRNLLYVGGIDDPSYLNPEGFGVRYQGLELVMHKIQDVIGELLLVGRMKNVHLHYVKTGHEFHLAAHRLLLNEGVFHPLS